jgi:hypothetical protein
VLQPRPQFPAIDMFEALDHSGISSGEVGEAGKSSCSNFVVTANADSHSSWGLCCVL